MRKLLLSTIMLCCMAVAQAQTDMTYRIVNPSFEKGFDGWQNEGMANQNNTSFKLKAGSCYAERWTGKGFYAGYGSLRQTITNLPNGTYTVSVAAQNIQQDTPNAVEKGVTLQAGKNKTDVGVAGTYSVTTNVANGSLDIAFVLDNATGNYVCVDNFKLSLDACEVEQVSNLVITAKKLAEKKMNSTVLDALNVAIKEAEKVLLSSEKQPTTKDLTDAAAKVSDCLIEAQASADAYGDLKAAIDDASTYLTTNPKNGADALKAELDKAQGVYDAATASDAEVVSAATALAGAVMTCRVANASGSAPKVSSEHFMPVGCGAALGRMTATGNNIVERGYVWATHPNPTVADNRSTLKYENNGDIYELSPLEPATQYYVRAYAMTKTYAVTYGEEQRIFTLPKATCRWSYDEAGDAATNERIRNAVKESCDLYNKWTSIPGFHLNAHYVPGAGAGGGTADCSYGGYMRVSQSVSYQRTGTLLHESNHGVGVGTSARWKNWDGSTLRDDGGERGQWLGWRATQMVRFFDHNNTSILNGDGTHMWPYGINGAHEDDNRKILYIANTLVTHAVHQDGLAAVDGIGASAAYTFEFEDGKNYFFANEDASCNDGGRAYLYESSTGALKWGEASADDITDDSSFAWQFEFVPEKAYYRIRNAKSGHYFTYSGSSIKAAAKTNPGASENFQLMVGFPEVTVGVDKKITKHGYWIQAGTGHFQPYTLAATATKSTRGEQLGNFSAKAPSKQRWLILTADEALPLATASADTYITDLRRLIDGTKALIDVPHTDSAEGATETVKALVADMEAKVETITGIADAKAAVTDLEAGIRAFIGNANPEKIEQPYDLTFLIAEPDFATTDAWSFNDLAVPTFANGVGQSSGTKFKMSQSFQNMPAGIYEMRIQACQQPDATSTFGFGTVTNKADVAKMDEGASADNPSQLFAGGAYDGSAVMKLNAAGSLDIMVSNSKSKFADGDITLFTNPRLYYYGNSVTKQEVTAVAIESIMDINSEQTLDIHDLTGRRIAQPSKGIYIVNGKKMLVK